jgi:hypothetical protein
MDDAFETGTDCLEQVAFDRAHEGSNALLIFLLKTRRREVYGDRIRQKHVRTDVKREQDGVTAHEELRRRILYVLEGN